MTEQLIYIICSCYSIILFITGCYIYFIALYFQVKKITKKRTTSLNDLLTMGFYTINALQIFGSLPLVAASAMNGGWLFGKYGCIFEGFLVHFTSAAAIGYLTLTAIDHHRAIGTDSALLRDASKRQKIITCVSPLIYGFLWASPPLFGWSEYVTEGIGIGCSVRWTDKNPIDFSYTMTIMVTSFAFPLFVIAVIYIRIFFFVKRHNRQFNLLLIGMNASVMSHRGSFSMKAITNQKRLAKMTISTVALFIACWSPYALVSLYSIFGSNTYKGHAIVTTLPALLAKSTTVVQGLMMARPPLFCKLNYQWNLQFNSSGSKKNMNNSFAGGTSTDNNHNDIYGKHEFSLPNDDLSKILLDSVETDV